MQTRSNALPGQRFSSTCSGSVSFGRSRDGRAPASPSIDHDQRLIRLQRQPPAQPNCRTNLFDLPGIETDSAGISNGASVLLSSEQVEWADIIFVMEKTHRTKLNRKFRPSLKGKRVICLDIPDDYEFMDPVLVRMLESRAGRFLPRP